MRPALTTTFWSLRIRNFRLFAGGQVISLSGTWAQRIAQDWLVLELSGGSGVALGLVTGLQFLPILLFSLYGGLLADRYDKRRMLVLLQAVMGLLALALGLLDVSGAVALWHVYALAFLLGLANAVEIPVRQTFVIELVGPDELPNAVSLNSATFNSARIVGPAVGGLLITAVGTGWVFLLNAASYAAVLIGLCAIRASELQPSVPVERTRGQVRAGLSYVRQRPDLLAPIVLVGVVGTFGLNFQLTLALVSREVFGRGAGAFALLTSMLAVGSLLGALASARRAGPPRVRRLLGSALAFGALLVLVGLAPSYALMAVLLVPTGFAVLLFSTTAKAIVQLGSDPHMRGRVVALYVLVFLGGTPVGAPLAGFVAEHLGPRASMVAGGLVVLLGAGLTTWYLAHHRELRLDAHLLRRRPHVHVRPTA